MAHPGNSVSSSSKSSRLIFQNVAEDSPSHGGEGRGQDAGDRGAENFGVFLSAVGDESRSIGAANDHRHSILLGPTALVRRWLWAKPQADRHEDVEFLALDS